MYNTSLEKKKHRTLFIWYKVDKREGWSEETCSLRESRMTPGSLADDTGVSSWPRKGIETSGILDRNLEETAQMHLLCFFYLIYFQSSATYCIISAHYFKAFWRGVVCYILSGMFETQHLRFILTYYLQNKDRVKMFNSKVFHNIWKYKFQSQILGETARAQFSSVQFIVCHKLYKSKKKNLII